MLNGSINKKDLVNIEMEKTYEVELDITQRFTTTVKVTGKFKDSNDPRIVQAAKQEADRMAHDDWNYDDTEFEIKNVIRTIPKNKVVLGYGVSGRASHFRGGELKGDNNHLLDHVVQQEDGNLFPFDETDFKGFEISKVRDEVDDSL
ncbi:hypothetical protein [Bacillus subtilis]|uniref:hypothetical protein n=1 Tax=Bacillus subtilis TaxID=1423 RepID=UPI002674A413|nr:hypothetical protein [Bacillus subtilis]MDO3655359.1 hypothetical protein [Bacillus subtilis]